MVPKALDLEITLEEAARGAEKEIGVSRIEKCDVCGGSGLNVKSKSFCSDVTGKINAPFHSIKNGLPDFWI